MSGRRAAAIVAALLLFVPSLGQAQSLVVYEFDLVYQGTCEGLTEGEIRILGSTVEMYGRDSGRTQLIQRTTIDSRGNFEIDVPGSGFRLTARAIGDTVHGDGRFTAFGSDCPFEMTGTLVSGSREEPTTTTTRGTTTTTVPEELEEVEFDPTSDEFLSPGEFETILRRNGVGESRIDDLVQSVGHASEIGLGGGVVMLKSLMDLENETGAPLFPMFYTLFLPGSEEQPAGPLNKLWRLQGTDYADAEMTTDFNRAVRLSLNMDLDS